MVSMGLNRSSSRSCLPAGCDKREIGQPGAGRPVDPGSKVPGWLVLFILVALLSGWPQRSEAMVIGLPDLQASRLLEQTFADGVGALAIQEAGGSVRGSGFLLNNRWVLTVAHHWNVAEVRGMSFQIVMTGPLAGTACKMTLLLMPLAKPLPESQVICSIAHARMWQVVMPLGQQPLV